MTRESVQWTKREVLRLEGFSDAVFAFALTLLVVSLEVPKTFDDLLLTLRGAPAFAVCFALFWLIWNEHHRFFHRYSLKDATTVTLNAVLLFVVLLYVYPLKFLSSLMLGGAREGGLVPIRPGQIRPLMLIYSAGYSAVFGIFALMYRHAYQRRAALGLDAPQIFETQAQMGSMLVHLAIGLTSAGVAALLPYGQAGLAGLVYFATGPAQTLYWKRVGKRRRLQRG